MHYEKGAKQLNLKLQMRCCCVKILRQTGIDRVPGGCLSCAPSKPGSCKAVNTRDHGC